MSVAASESKAAETSRGRPREFDPDEVLDRVVELFWDKGYEAASVADISEATGLNKSSLYNAFGSKEALFEQAVERYATTRIAMMTAVLRDGEEGMGDVERFFDLLRAEIEGETGARGCLVVNTSTELGYRNDAAQEMCTRYRGSLRSALRQAFARAEAAGEIAAGAGQGYAEVVLGWMLGMAVVARGGADAAEREAQFRAARSMVDGWRVG